ncbi:hypothetical protein CH267_00065 [Rhodococcus sp. 06-621-2]|nr:hypothetical protein [Rhodococcus sp. 06-621-2]OZC62792.1 hypothetical protein CH267_00065 [Rhodococcus sp. 06-621-2]
MNSIMDTCSIIARIFAAINIIAATYFHYRYTVRPSSTKNFRSAQLHWTLSGVFVAIAALTDNTLSTITTIVIVLGALIAPTFAITYLRKTRTRSNTTFLDRIAADDTTDHDRDARTHNTRDQD